MASRVQEIKFSLYTFIHKRPNCVDDIGKSDSPGLVYMRPKKKIVVFRYQRSKIFG